jgi:hypothetical protein
MRVKLRRNVPAVNRFFSGNSREAHVRGHHWVSRLHDRRIALIGEASSFARGISAHHSENYFTSFLEKLLWHVPIIVSTGGRELYVSKINRGKVFKEPDPFPDPAPPTAIMLDCPEPFVARIPQPRSLWFGAQAGSALRLAGMGETRS